MKIALLTYDFPPSIGGVQTYLYEISRRLSKWCDLSVITPPGSSLPGSIPFRQWSFSSLNPAHIIRILRKIQPDRVIVGHAHPRLLLPAAIVAWGRYAAITYGNDYLAAQGNWHTLLTNWLLSHSHPLITISHANVLRLRRLGMSPATIIPPGVDPQWFYPPAVRRSDSITLLSVARLVPRKGIALVLETLPLLLSEYPDLTYQIVGDGPDRPRLELLARQNQIEGSVHFAGSIPGEDLPELYRSAHIFILPTHTEPMDRSIEGFGIVYLEASASGLPVIAARSGGAPEAVLDGETGILIPPNDRTALFHALQKMVREPELRARLGHAGRRFVEERMTWDHAADKLIRSLEIG